MDWKKITNNWLPWVLFGGGFVAFTIGEFTDFANPKVKEYVSGLGKAILISGISGLLLQTFKYTGLFKEELTRVIFEPKYIQNRNDLPEFWEKLTKELFKNKFPHINQKITKDVKDIYLPTNLVQYYDNYHDIIDIELIDKVQQIIKVKQTTNFTIIANDVKEFTYPFRNLIKGKMNDNVTSCKLEYLKINGSDINPEVVQQFNEGILITKFVVNLKGNEVYNIEKAVMKTYSLKDDNIMGFRNHYIQNNFKVQFFLKNIGLDFYESGTLLNFKTVSRKEDYLEKTYDGLIYPRQGYIAVLKMKI